MKFQRKIIAFIDILGFKNLVEMAETNGEINLSELVEATTQLGTGKDEEIIAKNGPMICPQSKFTSKDLLFRVTQVSDCAVISAEVSPAGVINLVSHCSKAVSGLLRKGLMCRGYVTFGSIFHENGQFIGSGYQSALSGETSVKAFRHEADERGTPYVEIDKAVTQFIMSDECDNCVKTIFDRLTKTENGCTAIYPFQRFFHSFVIAGNGKRFVAEKEIIENRKIIEILTFYKDRVMNFVDPENDSAMKKARHYLIALEKQIKLCEEAENNIRKIDQVLSQPFPRHTIGDLLKANLPKKDKVD